ncbi:hypothetical protein EMIT0347P_70147 [Pseudomonas sp. IT-347P]
MVSREQWHVGNRTICQAYPIPVGVSLLAIAVYLSTFALTDTPQSRAGSLLQGTCGGSENLWR